MGATLARYEAKQAKRREYEPFVRELNQLVWGQFSTFAVTFDKPVEEWHTLETIQERLRRARLCKQLRDRRAHLLDQIYRLCLAGFSDLSSYHDEIYEKFLDDPEGRIMKIESTFRDAEVLKQAWLGRKATINQLPFSISNSDFSPLKRMTDAEFQLEIQKRLGAHRRQVHLDMAKRLVEQGFLPALDMCMPFMGYENVDGLEDMVQKRMQCRERYLERLSSQLLEPEPEEGSEIKPNQTINSSNS